MNFKNNEYNKLCIDTNTNDLNELNKNDTNTNDLNELNKNDTNKNELNELNKNLNDDEINKHEIEQLYSFDSYAKIRCDIIILHLLTLIILLTSIYYYNF